MLSKSSFEDAVKRVVASMELAPDAHLTTADAEKLIAGAIYNIFADPSLRREILSAFSGELNFLNRGHGIY